MKNLWDKWSPAIIISAFIGLMGLFVSFTRADSQDARNKAAEVEKTYTVQNRLMEQKVDLVEDMVYRDRERIAVLEKGQEHVIKSIERIDKNQEKILEELRK